MRTIYNETWGELTWLDPKDYFKGNWKYKGTQQTESGEVDIVMDNTGEFRYTRIWER